MPECPTFLDLPARPAKPRRSGITHVLDKGLTPEATRAFLGQAAHLVDIVKVGWGIGYVDPSLPARVRMCAEPRMTSLTHSRVSDRLWISSEIPLHA